MSASPRFLVLILALLLGLQPLTTDLYLPALPFITSSLEASLNQSQLTLSALMMAFGASQLIWGPVSDRYGRRPILLVGLAAYTLAAIAAALAPSMELLIMWRVVQGAAMGAVVMCARALVRDLYDNPVEAARIMSQALTGLGVAACVSTPIGGLITAWLGWRAALLFLVIMGAITLAVIAWRIDETLRAPDHDSLRPARLWRTWSTILGNHTFWSFSLLQTASYGGLFIFLASSSFVFIEYLGMSTAAYGVLMFSTAIAYIGGTLLCRRLLLRLSVQRTVALGGLLSITGGSLMALFALAGWHNLAALMLPFYLYMISHGINQPCAQSSVMIPFPKAAGAASALSAFVMVVGAFIIGQWLGQAMNGSATPMALGIWLSSLAVAATSWGLAARVDLYRPT
ncbi:Bcr/CflA family efflux MFS transporter [Natronospirillum operosum]|uniref:Bcr/CflA family efflux transporter n=1 Tax=Natronospirillum operosum TaxID=2759953 RepID=A0A4Z0WAX1_9GAMM|nr:Bcr/CflA family efflux MFS transporter [Natronospirillum operosum]TGG95799.1 Bcr/CflA family efflux MFS transporter [Natronospirillum operosum]